VKPLTFRAIPTISGAMMGLAIGVSIGVALQNIVLGLPIGAGLALLWAIVFNQAHSGRSGETDGK
jgi:hypothetical protein